MHLGQRIDEFGATEQRESASHRLIVNLQFSIGN
jgi:hypothetical protein